MKRDEKEFFVEKVRESLVYIFFTLFNYLFLSVTIRVICLRVISVKRQLKMTSDDN